MIKNTGKKRGASTRERDGQIVNRKSKSVAGSALTGRTAVKRSHARDETISGKYGTVRPEVREMVKRRLDKHASTWTELAKR
jgi:hypothetical protein